jgi:hypothetical protein
MRKSVEALQGEGEESIQEKTGRETGHNFLKIFPIPQREEAQSCTPERRSTGLYPRERRSKGLYPRERRSKDLYPRERGSTVVYPRMEIEKDICTNRQGSDLLHEGVMHPRILSTWESQCAMMGMLERDSCEAPCSERQRTESNRHY